MFVSGQRFCWVTSGIICKGQVLKILNLTNKTTKYFDACVIVCDHAVNILKIINCQCYNTFVERN